jgi:glucan 1,4-alpha-glucosidase
MLDGPMDSMPGLFHLRLNQFVPSRTTRVRTTLAKQLALFVTISPLQMAADLPENYEAHPDASQSIRDVPVDWDETRILAAEPGDYLLTARCQRGKPDWYVGAITDENSRTLPLSLSFLESGQTYATTLYRDAPTTDWETNPKAYVIDRKTVTNQDTSQLILAKGGGCAIQLRRN